MYVKSNAIQSQSSKREFSQDFSVEIQGQPNDEYSETAPIDHVTLYLPSVVKLIEKLIDQLTNEPFRVVIQEGDQLAKQQHLIVSLITHILQSIAYHYTRF